MFFGGKMLPHALSIFDIAILHTARKWQVGKLINLTMFGKGMSKDKVLSVITGAKSICYDLFHNILRLFDVSPNFSFTTSETMRDYYL